MMSAVAAEKLALKAWFHPSLQLPFKINAVMASPSMQIVDLMDEVEGFYQEYHGKAGIPLDFQVNVVWNTKDHNKALNPHDELGKHFVSGETFGVFGDVLPLNAGRPLKAEEEKVPVVVLTGLPGSGRTSLLNFILQVQKGRRIAIIESAFGAASQGDAQGDAASMADKVVVTDNGCIHCTITDDLVSGLWRVLGEIHKGNAVDTIVIKTTGMGESAVRTFMSAPALRQDLRLDEIISVVDAKDLACRSEDETGPDMAIDHQQLGLADKVILTKLDLITTEQATRVHSRIQSINKFARVSPAALDFFEMDQLLKSHVEPLAHLALEAEAEDARPVDDRQGVSSFAIVREGEITPRHLFSWTQSLNALEPKWGTIFRIKATLAVKGHPIKRVLNAVMDVIDERDAGLWAEGERKVSKIVFVGRSLDKRFFTQGFESLFLD